MARCGHRSTAPVSGLVLAGAEKVRVDAQVKIQKAVAVVVGHRDRRQHALQRLAKLKGVGDDGKPAFVVEEKERLRPGGEHEILVAIVVDVGEERLRGVVEHAKPCAFGRVLERAIAARPVKAIGEP